MASESDSVNQLYPDMSQDSQDLSAVPTSLQTYKPVPHHWFHRKDFEVKTVWEPFSVMDSLMLEECYISTPPGVEKIVATDGGRYDVNVLKRERRPVYWKGDPTEVRRCSWFYKGSVDSRFTPYEESVAEKLEEEFKNSFETNNWGKKVELATGETVMFHSPDILVLFPPTLSSDAWGQTPNQIRPRVVKRGVSDFDIDEGEPSKIDHLLFLVHGIGSVCDLKLRTVEEAVDEFRSVSLQLIRSHYRSAYKSGLVSRIEVLPISWHEALHSEETDKKLKSITLESIPRLRDFTNDTILDVLFYTSPVYCQTIIQAVGNQMNAIYEQFKKRNPNFKGGVSLGGHSLGSLILFDLLCHQHPELERETSPQADEDVLPPLADAKPPPFKRKISRRISYMMSTIGTGQPQITYPHLTFQPKAFFALGSPIAMFVTVRGLDTLGENFALPTCPAFFNIFHPYDPVAYRIESLINPALADLKPVLIPHHKGRKRMHLELRETMAKVGADLKQKVVESVKSTWNTFYQFSLFPRGNSPVNQNSQSESSHSEDLSQEKDEQEQKEQEQSNRQAEENNISCGILNKGRRMDYVLQEGPLEFFNEYLFALTSHVCYWESEDTMLLILKEIYSDMNISTDCQIPQQSMTIERQPSPSRRKQSESDNGV